MKIILMLYGEGERSTYPFLNALKKSAKDRGFYSEIEHAGALFEENILKKYENIDFLFIYAPDKLIKEDAFVNSLLPISVIIISQQLWHLIPALKNICETNQIQLLTMESNYFALRSADDYLDLFI